MIYSFENIVFYHYFMIDMTNFVVFSLDFDFDRSELYIILIVLMQRIQIYIRTQSELYFMRNYEHFLLQKNSLLTKNV